MVVKKADSVAHSTHMRHQAATEKPAGEASLNDEEKEQCSGVCRMAACRVCLATCPIVLQTAHGCLGLMPLFALSKALLRCWYCAKPLNGDSRW